MLALYDFDVEICCFHWRKIFENEYERLATVSFSLFVYIKMRNRGLLQLGKSLL